MGRFGKSTFISIIYTVILRSEMKSASKVFWVPSEYFVALFISLRSYTTEAS